MACLWGLLLESKRYLIVDTLGYFLFYLCREQKGPVHINKRQTAMGMFCDRLLIERRASDYPILPGLVSFAPNEFQR